MNAIMGTGRSAAAPATAAVVSRVSEDWHAGPCLRRGTNNAMSFVIAPQALLHCYSSRGRTNSLEPISKSPEEDNEASELYEAEEVLGVVFPTDDDAALPLNPSKEALHEPASHIAA